METAQIRILVIDDEKSIRDMLRLAFSRQGYETETSEDGEQGIQKFKERTFDIVICDLKMPRIGGLETLKAIKTLNPATEVIIATGYVSIDEAKMTTQHGAFDILLKPYVLQDIFSVVKRAIEKRK